MASGHPQIRHRARSVCHKQKFQMLKNAIQMSSDKLRHVDGYIMCAKDEYKLGLPTSDGTCVYIGLRVHDGKEVAIKCMVTDVKMIAENETDIYNMMKMEKSPHIVRYLNFVEQDPFTYIVLELCEFSLKEYVEKAHEDNRIPFNTQKIIKEMLTGLDVLHKRGDGEQEMILHRDLKPDNVLVDVAYNIRLADFGVSKKFVEGQSTTYTSRKGKAEWQATESISINGENVVYRRKSDVQVAGMLAFYVLTEGKHPFGDLSYDIPNNIYHGNPVNLDKFLTNPVEKDFISWLLQKNIDDRPFADEALTHPYLKSLKDQFALLVAVGNQPEVVHSNPCFVVDQLNHYSKDYPNGWQQKIHAQIMSEFTANHSYNNAITRLLRFLRNVEQHINDSRTSENIRQLIGEPSLYFLHEDRFPILPMRVYRILKNEAKLVAPAEAWINRPTLKDFF